MAHEAGPDAKRRALRQRIDNAQQRLDLAPAKAPAAARANGALAYAKDNPALVIGGVAAVAIALGLLTRRGGKVASSANATGVLTRIATDAAIAFALAMYEKAASRA
ncbi:MAG: hypothetical protein ACO25F_12200, partial [Erythrobacter sp.]